MMMTGKHLEEDGVAGAVREEGWAVLERPCPVQALCQ